MQGLFWYGFLAEGLLVCVIGVFGHFYTHTLIVKSRIFAVIIAFFLPQPSKRHSE
jgi:hypothetical protein